MCKLLTTTALALALLVPISGSVNAEGTGGASSNTGGGDRSPGGTTGMMTTTPSAKSGDAAGTRGTTVTPTGAPTVDPSTEVLTALALITQKRVRHLPVVSGGQLVGIVSIGDLVKYRIERIEFEAQAMRDYIQSV